VQYLTIWDLVLTPVYLLVLIAIARKYRDNHFRPGDPLRKYYLPGLYVKFGGAIFIALIYQFYYGGGDTFNFFNDSRIVNSSLDDSFSTWAKLIFRSSPSENPELYKYTSQMLWYDDPPSYAVVITSAILGLFNGTTYIPIALLFSFIAYTGIWAMYKTFYQIYPKVHKELAVAFLFIPSTFVWGSAIFKDTLCMFGLGWMTYTTFRIFINRDFSIKNLVLMVFSFYIIGVVKLYILLSFIPALSLWLMMNYSKKIRSVGLRWMTNIFFIALTIGGFLFFTSRFAKEMNKYSLEKIAQTSLTTRDWIEYTSGDEGSAYSLGEMDGSLAGMLIKAPAAISVTLFRPFLWESRKVIIFLSAVEALFFLYFTLKIIFKGRGKVLALIVKDPNILFCLVFTIIFAFAVGISTYNFGSLSRYKIPCLPFFGAFLALSLNSISRSSVRPQKSAPSPIRERPPVSSL
jgi:hypothetical protein